MVNHYFWSLYQNSKTPRGNCIIGNRVHVQTKEIVSSLETWDVMKMHLLIYYPCNVLGSERTLTTSCRARLGGVCCNLVLVQDLIFFISFGTPPTTFHVSLLTHTISQPSRPVNLPTLFLFWKHGSVCDPEKNQVQNMDLKKAGCKKRGQCYSKREEAAWPLLFLNNNDPVFLQPAFFRYIFWTWFFSGLQTDPCFQNKNSGCRLTGQR